METSQLFQRCLRQALLRSPRCKNGPSTARQLSTIHLIPRNRGTSPSISSTRHFSLTPRRHDESTTPRPSKQPPNGPPSRFKPHRAQPAFGFNLLDIVKRGDYSQSKSTRAPSKDPLDALEDGFSTRLSGDPVNRYMDASARNRPSQSTSPRNPDQDQVVADMLSYDTPGYNAPKLRLKPTLGRTVAITGNRGMDVTRAFRMLEMRCTANSVRKDARDQKTYVRRGQQKKLDKMRRWRALFQDGFLAECARIRKMRAQGW